MTIVTIIILVIVTLAIKYYGPRRRVPRIYVNSTRRATSAPHRLETIDRSLPSANSMEIEFIPSSDEDIEIRSKAFYPDVEQRQYSKGGVQEYSRIDNRVLAYDNGNQGPTVNVPMGVPVPAGALKESSEKYDAPFYRALRPLESDDYFKPYVLDQPSPKIVVSDTPFYRQRPKIQGSTRSTGSTNGASGAIPFISSTNAFAPRKEINTKWEKIGIVQTVNVNDNTIMNIYRRPIAPLQDLYEYAVQDKDGFIVPLLGVAYLEDQDVINSIPGRESLGEWKVNIYVNNKYILM